MLLNSIILWGESSLMSSQNCNQPVRFFTAFPRDYEISCHVYDYYLRLNSPPKMIPWLLEIILQISDNKRHRIKNLMIMGKPQWGKNHYRPAEPYYHNMHWQHALCLWGGRNFVSKSDKFTAPGSYVTQIPSAATDSLTLWYATELCFLENVLSGLDAFLTTLSLSQNVFVGPVI